MSSAPSDPQAEERKGSSGPVPIRRLLALARPEWKRLVWGTLALLLASGTGLLFPLAIGRVVDSAVVGGARNLVDRWALALVVVLLLQSVFVFLRNYLFSIAGERIVARLRADLYRSILRQEIGFFDRHETGEIASRLSADAATLQRAATENVSSLLTSLFGALLGVALLFWLSPLLTILMLDTVPPVIVGTILLGRRLRSLSKDIQDALARTGEVVHETVSGIRTVRAFAAEERESRRYGGRVWEVFEKTRRMTIVHSLFGGVTWFAGFGTVAFVFWYGGRLVLAGEMTVGELTSFLIYTLTISTSLAGLASVWGQFMRASGASQRVFELMDRQPEMPLTGGRTLARPRGALAFEGVGFRYPMRDTVQVLTDVSLSIEPGEVIALVGPSGAGKSTIAALVSRFYDPTAGIIRLDGVDLRELDPTWLRTQVGTVSQEPILFSTTIEENIRYGRPDVDEAAFLAACRTANVEEFVRHLPEGYRTRVGERGLRLSGGQKQRVAIARAVLEDPAVLILDEATSALDADSEALVREALARLMRSRTTIVIAHRLSTVRDAHRVVVLDHGRAVQIGPHERLLEQAGLYRQLVRRQFEFSPANG